VECSVVGSIILPTSVILVAGKALIYSVLRDDVLILGEIDAKRLVRRNMAFDQLDVGPSGFSESLCRS